MWVSRSINFCDINLPKAFGFVWVKRKDCIEKPDSKREVMNKADGHLFPAWPQGVGGVQTPNRKGLQEQLLCRALLNLRDSMWLGVWSQRRFSAIGSMPTGPALEQEKLRRRSCACGVRLCGCLVDVPRECDTPSGGLYRHQGPACATRVAASEAWMVTAIGTSLAGRSGEIQVTLSKHSHITEHRVWRVHYTNCFHFAKLTL